MGVKDVDVRSYPLAHAKGSPQFCHEDEDMSVIETRQRGQADVEGAILPLKPVCTQVPGTVSFSHCKEYQSAAEFRQDTKRHRIPLAVITTGQTRGDVSHGMYLGFPDS